MGCIPSLVMTNTPSVHRRGEVAGYNPEPQVALQGEQHHQTPPTRPSILGCCSGVCWEFTTDGPKKSPEAEMPLLYVPPKKRCIPKNSAQELKENVLSILIGIFLQARKGQPQPQGHVVMCEWHQGLVWYTIFFSPL